MSEMEPERFDILSRSIAVGIGSRPARRRRLLAGGGGAILGLIGFGAARAQDDDLGGATGQTPEATTAPDGETPPETDAGDLCVMEFTATVRTGPTLERGSDPVLSGRLSFQLGEDAELVARESRLEADGGNQYPVTGQTRGRAVSLRISLGPSAIVAIGTAQESARSCAGEIRGVTAGPLPGDLGDWVARAVSS